MRTLQLYCVPLVLLVFALLAAVGVSVSSAAVGFVLAGAVVVHIRAERDVRGRL